MKNLFDRFVREEAGQDLTEYAMLVAFIAFIVLVGVTLFGQNLQAWWNSVAGAVGGWAPA
jgi:pilus assembly protein Flp/PilA